MCVCVESVGYLNYYDFVFFARVWGASFMGGGGGWVVAVGGWAP